MKNIYLIIIAFLVFSCNNEQNSSTDNTISTQNVDSLKTPVDNSISSENIILPVIGKIDLSSMNMDSINEYGGGDCWGAIEKYSSKDFSLAIDSMSCGDYGFTNTYYILKNKDEIEAVYIQKLELGVDYETDSYIYVLQDQMIDFKSEPSVQMVRTDSIRDYVFGENKIDKEFTSNPLEDKQKVYDQFYLEYKNAWQWEIEEEY